MRRLVERGLPELIVAGTAGHPDVPHAAAALGSFPGRRTDAGLPADLGPAGPKLMTERATLRLVFENRYWHENDHAQAGGFSVLPVQVNRALCLSVFSAYPRDLKALAVPKDVRS